jgi:hypothetical protein
MLDENFSLFYVKIFFMALRVVHGVFLWKWKWHLTTFYEHTNRKPSF